MRVARGRAKSRPEARPIVKALQVIAEFLNAVTPDMTEETWARVCRGLQEKAEMSRRTLWATHADAILLRRRLEGVLADVIGINRMSDEDFERSKQTWPPSGPFSELIACLNDCRFRLEWQCDRLEAGEKPGDPFQPVMTVRRGKAIVGRWVTRSSPKIMPTLEEWCYSILGRALETGDLLRLKMCRQCKCKRYFVAAKDSKREFCPETTCKDDYHNLGKTQAWRKRERRKKLKLAKALLEQGEKDGTPLRIVKNIIHKKTGLGERVIERFCEHPTLPPRTASTAPPTAPPTTTAPSKTTLVSMVQEYQQKEAAYMERLRASNIATTQGGKKHGTTK